MRPSDAKQREAVYQQICAQILRESGDLAAFRASAGRALASAAVAADPELAARLRSFIAEQEQAFRMRTLAAADALREAPQSYRPFERVGGAPPPTRAQVVAEARRIEHDLSAMLAVFSETEARRILRRLVALRERYPVHISAEVVEEWAARIARMCERRELYRSQIDELARRGIAAAKSGNLRVAGWVLRRLQAVHTLRPTLLSHEHFQELRARIQHAADRHDHREAVRALLTRERHVAEEIKELGAVIRRFHEAARRLPPDDAEFQAARRAYESAAAAVRVHDEEWLAGLILELEALLDELEDDGAQAHRQLTQFVDSVRTALERLRKAVARLDGQCG